MRSLSIIATFIMVVCSGLQAQTVAQYLLQGDAYAAKLQTTDALNSFLPAEKLDPTNAQILVRIAREYRHLMFDAAKPEDKLRLGYLALDYSTRAAALAPTDSVAQIAPGVTYGKLLPLLGSKEQFAASRLIKEAADKAIALDPKNDVAWHLLGRWHQALANISVLKSVFAPMLYGTLPKTTNTEAVKCFQAAIKINPTRFMHHIELGRTYALMGKDSDAKRELVAALKMPDVEKDDPETRVRGKDALAKLP